MQNYSQLTGQNSTAKTSWSVNKECTNEEPLHNFTHWKNLNVNDLKTKNKGTRQESELKKEQKKNSETISLFHKIDYITIITFDAFGQFESTTTLKHILNRMMSSQPMNYINMELVSSTHDWLTTPYDGDSLQNNGYELHTRRLHCIQSLWKLQVIYILKRY
jgi:hypothetical protein